MDEEIPIINRSTREERIKNFFIKNKNKIITIVSVLILILFSLFFYKEYNDRNRELLANKYNLAIAEYNKGDKSKVTLSMQEIIADKDGTYSPLALYFLIDNKILTSKDEINKYFNQIINEVKLDIEIKNLVIYKKALFNSDFDSLYLLAEYYLNNNQKQKAKEFYQQILNLKSANRDIVVEAKKRLQSEYSE